MINSNEQTIYLFISQGDSHEHTQKVSNILCIDLPDTNAYTHRWQYQSQPSVAGGTDFAAIDAYVTEQLNDLGIPGMALGIVQDGQIVHLQSFGVADSAGGRSRLNPPFTSARSTSRLRRWR
jgi:CubicO group peptidase (beta-lactamase class C family)